MVNRAERASLQKSVIDDVNNHITASITEKLKTKRAYSGELFVSTRPEIFYFKTDDWIYSVSCLNSDLNAYRVIRSSFWVDASGNTIYRNINKMTTEEYSIMPTTSANKTELKYCDPYNNHIARRFGITHTRISCPFKMNCSSYLDLLLKNLTDTPHARVIAPCPDYKEPVVEVEKVPLDLAEIEKAVNFVELPEVEPVVIEEQIEPVEAEPVVHFIEEPIVEPVVAKTKRKRSKK
jgi:hypothetical protein